jgi:hypothetical protein
MDKREGHSSRLSFSDLSGGYLMDTYGTEEWVAISLLCILAAYLFVGFFITLRRLSKPRFDENQAGIVSFVVEVLAWPAVLVIDP